MRMLKSGTITKMNKKAKRMWLKALRSKEYKQGAGELRTEDKQGAEELRTEDGEGNDFEVMSYCCLGVLTDIALSDIGGKWGSCGNDAIPPTRVGTWAGINFDTENLVRYSNEKGQGEQSLGEFLGYLNDVEKWSFKKIANWIEKYL